MGDHKFSSSSPFSLVGDSARGSRLAAALVLPRERMVPLSAGDCRDTSMHFQARLRHLKLEVMALMELQCFQLEIGESSRGHFKEVVPLLGSPMRS